MDGKADPATGEDSGARLVSGGGQPRRAWYFAPGSPVQPFTPCRAARRHIASGLALTPVLFPNASPEWPSGPEVAKQGVSD